MNNHILLIITIFLFIINALKNRLYTLWKQSKSTYSLILIFIITPILIIISSSAIFIYFSQPTLYHTLNITRKSTGSQIDQAVSLRIKSFSNMGLPKEVVATKIHQTKQMGDLLKHSARRLMYDSYQITDLQSVYSFYNPTFIIQQIMGMAINLIICFGINLALSQKKNKSQLQYHFILLSCFFAYTIHVNLTCESRMVNWSDWLDQIIPNVTIHRRIQILLNLFLPLLSYVQFLVLLFYSSKQDLLLKKLDQLFHPIIQQMEKKGINMMKIIKQDKYNNTNRVQQVLQNEEHSQMLKSYFKACKTIETYCQVNKQKINNIFEQKRIKQSFVKIQAIQ